MKQDVLRKVQLAQLEIAREIRRVCEENDIRYVLCDGTFLGAIRHKGFIPWDDDMDIAMVRSEYEKFCRIAPEKLKPEYFLQTWYSDEAYALPFAKVRKRGTLFVEAKSKQLKENGFFVDIFPLDFAWEDPQKQAELIQKLLSIYRMKLMKCGYTPWMEGDRVLWKKRMGYLYYQVKAMFVSGEDLSRAFDQLATSVSPTGLVCERCDISHDKPFPVDLFENPVDCIFENEVFAGPSDYDKYLTINYGDYMRLPPEDQRENRHQVEKLDFGT